MVRGPRLHMKRINAPSNWMLHKMGGIYAPRASQGGHKMVQSIPLTLIIRDKLHLARDMRESGMIIRQNNVLVDGKPRHDEGFPVGFQDVVEIPKCNKIFRLVYDPKGRFQLLAIKKEEAQYKLLKIQDITIGEKGIYYAHCHDGRNVRFIDPSVKRNDTIKYDLQKNAIVDVIKFDKDMLAQVISGKSAGRIGKVVQIDTFDGSHNMVYLVDAAGNKFNTREENIFIIGKDKSLTTLPKSNGVRVNIEDNRKLRLASIEKQKKTQQ